MVSARRSIRLSAEDFMERVREKDVCFLCALSCAGNEVSYSGDQEDISSVDIYAIRRPYFTIADLIDDDEYVDIFTDENMCDQVNDEHVTRIRNVLLYKRKGEACGIRGAGNSKTSYYRSKARKHRTTEISGNSNSIYKSTATLKLICPNFKYTGNLMVKIPMMSMKNCSTITSNQPQC